MQIPEYDEDSAPEVRRADEAYDAQLVAERQDARLAAGVHALFLIAAHGTMHELRRAMSVAFAAPSRRPS